VPEDKNEKKALEMFKEAKQAVHQNDWAEAVKRFRQIAEVFSESTLTDDSLYWMGYSMNRLSKTFENMDKLFNTQKDALVHLETLLKRYPTSKWIDDAKLLRVEIAQTLVEKGFNKYKYILNGASKDSDLDVKLTALDALLQMDKKKAFPILEKIMRSDKNPELKEKAIFILSQYDYPGVIPLLAEIILVDSNKKVREKAIFWLGQIRGTDSLNELIRIYSNIQDVKLKETIIYSIAQNGDKGVKCLIDFYWKEKNLQLKKKIVFWLGQSGNKEARKLIEKILME
jgi:hypothetical protein